LHEEKTIREKGRLVRCSRAVNQIYDEVDTEKIMKGRPPVQNEYLVVVVFVCSATYQVHLNGNVFARDWQRERGEKGTNFCGGGNQALL
jgi:hypothetical protein